jgi:predicted phage terminase large subunit-like protein
MIAKTTTADAAMALARTDLACYCAIAWHRFELAHHHRLIIDQLERIERGEIDRLILTMPPRHGKSLLASQLFPAWYLGRHPDRSIIAASYAAELATDFGRKVRNHVTEPLFSRIFPNARLAGDSAAAHRFSLLAGGAYYAVGAGGPITGRGAELLLIDDPIKSRVDANSEAHRRGLQSWFESVAYPRLMPGGAIVLIQTRWHMDDLAGWCLREQAQEGWVTLNLPAIAETEEGWRREGEALWPAKFPLKRLMQIRQTIGGSEWAALYQGTPAAAEGALFRREWWKFYDASTLPARFEQIVLSLDTAFKSGSSNDYSVGLVLGVGRTGYYVLDVWRGRVEFPELKRQAEMLTLKWNPDTVLIEDKASGQSLIQELQNSGRLPIRAIKVDADKVTRATACTPLVEAGKVLLPAAAPWLADFVEEISAFPAAPHDDQVDAFSQALNYVRESGTGLMEFYRAGLEAAARGEPDPWADAGAELVAEYDRVFAELTSDDARCGACGLPIEPGLPRSLASNGEQYHQKCALR